MGTNRPGPLIKKGINYDLLNLSITPLLVTKLTFATTEEEVSNETRAFDQGLRAVLPVEIISTIEESRRLSKKPWTIIIYMAADNDLRNFATRNIKQMASIGSNDQINIVVHLD